MDDATSGSPNSGFFDGNNYWTGSMRLCQNIFEQQTNLSKAPFIPRFSKMKFILNEPKISPDVSELKKE